MIDAVLGAGGHGRELIELLRDAASPTGGPDREMVVLDDDPELHGTRVGGVAVAGPLSMLTRLGPEVSCYLGVGYPEVKRRIFEAVPGVPVDWPPAVHRFSAIGGDVEVGRGVLVQAGCVVTTGVKVGGFATLNVGATVSHDCTVAEWATLSPGVHIAGNVSIGEGAFLGIGASVIQNVRIGAWSVVGAGALVLEDVEPHSVVVGVPARPIPTYKKGSHGSP